MKGKKRNYVLAAVLLAMMGAAAGVTAAYLSRSPGVVQNVITVGTIKAELTEEHWKPENGAAVYPGESIDKDPVVKNTGENDAYVFLEVSVPIENIALVERETERKTERQSCELFSFHADEESWKPLEYKTADGQACYVYGYKKVLQPGEKTTPLFEQVTAVNYLEGELQEGENYGIHVTAKAIQGNTDEQAVEQIYMEFVKQYEDDRKGGAE